MPAERSQDGSSTCHLRSVTGFNSSQLIPLDNAGGLRAPESNYPNCLGWRMSLWLVWPGVEARNTSTAAPELAGPWEACIPHASCGNNPEHSCNPGWPACGNCPGAAFWVATEVWRILPRSPLLPPSLPQGGAGHSPWQKTFIFGLATHNAITQTIREFVAFGAVPADSVLFPTETPLPNDNCHIPIHHLNQPI